ncbi:hypothetical protein [Arthrobacter sp. efr-133-R2A-120]|uniref:hypothetical protein n=1 Tax=Arthrobacter sp. efr-133-R2A-120 TaxID=3040277 RepID=UPI00254BF085|nr:hypothetical protein [Arthrobacter sp. efr-133-R2A-120]
MRPKLEFPKAKGRHVRSVTEQPGLYALGLPWLQGHYSSIVGGVGVDAEYVPGRVAGGEKWLQ